MIKEIVVNQVKFEYPVFLFEYLNSYLFRFALENGIYKGQEVLNIDGDLLVKLKTSVESGLRDLLDNLYEEPSHKNRSKHGSRYQKIPFEGKIYIVNFRTDPIGNVSYGIFMLLNWIDKQIAELAIYEEE